MQRSIYNLLNEVDINLETYDKEEFNDIERKKINTSLKNKVTTKITYTKVVSLAAIVVALSVALLVTNMGVYAYEGASQIFNTIANYLGMEKSLGDYTTAINQAVTKQGITVKLNEIILDYSGEMLVSTTTTTDEKTDNCSLMGTSVLINGKEMFNSFGGSTRRLDEYMSDGLSKFTWNTKKVLTGDLNIKIVFDTVYVNGVNVKGPWVFEFKANGEELAKNTFEIQINNTLTFENDQKVILEKFTSNDLVQKLYFSEFEKGCTIPFDRLKGHDDLGNSIEFCLSPEEQGKEIFRQNGYTDGKIDNNAKVLYLTPYMQNVPDKNDNYITKQVGEEFTIALSK